MVLTSDTGVVVPSFLFTHATSSTGALSPRLLPGCHHTAAPGRGRQLLVPTHHAALWHPTTLRSQSLFGSLRWPHAGTRPRPPHRDTAQDPVRRPQEASAEKQGARCPLPLFDERVLPLCKHVQVTFAEHQQSLYGHVFGPHPQQCSSSCSQFLVRTSSVSSVSCHLPSAPPQGRPAPGSAAALGWRTHGLTCPVKI